MARRPHRAARPLGGESTPIELDNLGRLRQADAGRLSKLAPEAMMPAEANDGSAIEVTEATLESEIDVSSMPAGKRRDPPAARAARTSERFIIGVLALAAFALVVRITWVASTWGTFQLGADARLYYVSGHLLADGHGFASPGEWLLHHRLTPSAFHTPLYPIFLGVLTKVGIGTVNGQRLASCLVGTATVVVIAFAARHVAGERAGLVAAAIAAVYPGLWIYDGTHESESVEALIYATVVLLAYRFLSRPTVGRVVLLGMAVGAAILGRTEAALLVPVLCIPAVRSRRFEMSKRDRATRLVAIGLATIALPLPWVVRNLTVFDHPEVLSSGAGYVLAYGSCDATFHGPWLGWWAAGCLPRGDIELRSNQDESDQETALRRHALSYVESHLSRVPVVMAARLGRVFGVYRVEQGIGLNGNYEFQALTLTRVIYYAFWVLGALSLIGCVVLRRRGEALWPLTALLVIAAVGAMVSFGILRYRVSAEVAVPVLAAVAVDALYERVATRPRPLSARLGVTPGRPD